MAEVKVDKRYRCMLFSKVRDNFCHTPITQQWFRTLLCLQGVKKIPNIFEILIYFLLFCVAIGEAWRAEEAWS